MCFELILNVWLLPGWVAAVVVLRIGRIANTVPATFPEPHRQAACPATVRFVDRRCAGPGGRRLRSARDRLGDETDLVMVISTSTSVEGT